MIKKFLQPCRQTMLFKVVLIALLLFPATSLLSAGQLSAKLVKGNVVSATGNEPLIGATVTVEGTMVMTVTDYDGNFSIDANEGQSITVSYVGFHSKTVTVKGNNLQITLDEDVNSLDEVVAIGYGVVKKKLVTGANLQIKGDDIAKMNTSNPLQAMQGQTPGMTIISTSGQPGADLKVNIRGMGTMGTSSPLYIIDGIRGDISTLNSADIESIDVLKDAASTAIYGSAGANGVVLVTTKSGRNGKAQVTFDGYRGWQNVERKSKMLNAEEYQVIMDEAAINSGSAVNDWASYGNLYDQQGKVVNTDWIDQMFKNNAMTESYNVGVNGGNKDGNYSLSLGYFNQEGIVGGKDVSNYERYNGRLNSNWTLYNGILHVGEQIAFSYKKNKGISVGNAYNNTLRGAFNTSPLAPVYDADGNYNSTKSGDWYAYDGNPYGVMMVTSNNQTNNANLSANLYAELEPIHALKLKTVLGYTYSSSDYRSFSPIYHFSDYSQRTSNVVNQNKNDGYSLTWTNTISYDWKMGQNALSAMAGMEAYKYSGSYVGAGNGLLRPGFDSWYYAYVDNGTAQTKETGLTGNGSPNEPSRMISYFGRLSWNYKETYMATANFRYDGNDNFAPGHKWGFFPSVSAGWIMSNESWMQPIKDFMDFFKLRVSWGQNGNADITKYGYTAPIKFTNSYYNFGTTLGADGNVYGAYSDALANPDLTWETSEQFDAGFDARFFDGRLNVNMDYYIKTTKDWLVQAPLPKTSGVSYQLINGGDVRNSGLELGFNWNDKIGKDFGYNAGFNFAYNKNEVTRIANSDGIIHGTDGAGQLYDNSTEFYRSSVGQPIGYFWGYKTAGIFQNKQEIDDWKAAENGILQANVQPGDVKYIDVDHDNVIDDNDKVNLGNGMPDWTLGFSLGCNYKNFDFSMTANASLGNQIVQSYRNQSNAKANYTTEILGRWTGEGTSNHMPRITQSNINWLFSDLYIHDGDFLRISNITLGYDFSKLLACQYVSEARLYLQVQNAFTFTKYNGMDPEIGYGVNSWASGIDLGYYPRPRTVLIGVNLKF